MAAPLQHQPGHLAGGGGGARPPAAPAHPPGRHLQPGPGAGRGRGHAGEWCSGDTCLHVYPARVQVVLVTATVHLVGAEYLLSPQPRDQDTFLLALMVDMFFAWLY